MHEVVYKIGDISDIFVGGDRPKMVSDDKNDECPFPIYSNGISNEGLYGWTSTNKVNGDSITVSARGVNIGTVFYRKTPYYPIVRLLCIEPNKDCIYPKYLYYYLKQANINGTGSAQPQITKPFFSKMKINVFEDIKYQKKIADALSKYDDLIEINTKKIELLESIAETIYNEWIVRKRYPGYDLDNKDKTWEVKKLIDLVDFDSGFEPGASEYSDDNTLTPFIRVGDLGEDSTSCYIKAEDFPKAKFLNKEDVVISFDASLGKMDYGMSGAYSSGVCKISGKNNEIMSNMLVYCMFHSQAIQSFINSYGNGATISHAGKCKKRLQCLYNEDVFRLFSNTTKPIYNELINLKIANDNIKIQMNMLMQRLLSGEIEI